MSLKRTESCPATQKYSPSVSIKRKRKASKIASHFELVRPGQVPGVTPKKRKNVLTENKTKSMVFQSSASMPSVNTKISTRNTSTSSLSTTHTSSPTLPQHLNGNKSFSIDRLSHINPMHFAQSCLKSYGIDSEAHDSLTKKNFFFGITEDNLAAYQPDVIQNIRLMNVDALREIKKTGRSLQGCNRFGESMMHIACRRGSPDVLSFLINEGECTLRVHDDYGRTPLHDACWQAEPNFELIEIVLDAEPDLLLLRDKRGNTALDYVRREHWGLWVQYLALRMKKEIRRQLLSQS